MDGEEFADLLSAAQTLAANHHAAAAAEGFFTGLRGGDLELFICAIEPAVVKE